MVLGCQLLATEEGVSMAEQVQCVDERMVQAGCCNNHLCAFVRRLRRIQGGQEDAWSVASCGQLSRPLQCRALSSGPACRRGTECHICH